MRPKGADNSSVERVPKEKSRDYSPSFVSEEQNCLESKIPQACQDVSNVLTFAKGKKKKW